MCPECRSWWELCPKCEDVANRRADFMESLRRQIKRDEGIQVAPYGGPEYAPWEKFKPNG